MYSIISPPYIHIRVVLFDLIVVLIVVAQVGELRPLGRVGNLWELD